MLWVDHDTYFGPDRRRQKGGLRLRERRRYDQAAQPPSLSIAMRQLRMRVLDAQGERTGAFADRIRGTAQIARLHNEPAVSNALNTLANQLSAARGADIRQALYTGLDRAHAAMRAA
jgi:hypothetical protein